LFAPYGELPADIVGPTIDLPRTTARLTDLEIGLDIRNPHTSPIRFSLTGADSNFGVLAAKHVRRAANRKTLFIIACYWQGSCDFWLGRELRNCPLLAALAASAPP
jgi:hypothetical protein